MATHLVLGVQAELGHGLPGLSARAEGTSSWHPSVGQGSVAKAWGHGCWVTHGPFRAASGGMQAG